MSLMELLARPSCTSLVSPRSGPTSVIELSWSQRSLRFVIPLRALISVILFP